MRRRATWILWCDVDVQISERTGKYSPAPLLPASRHLLSFSFLEFSWLALLPPALPPLLFFFRGQTVSPWLVGLPACVHSEIILYYAGWDDCLVDVPPLVFVWGWVWRQDRGCSSRPHGSVTGRVRGGLIRRAQLVSCLRRSPDIVTADSEWPHSRTRSERYNIPILWHV